MFVEALLGPFVNYVHMGSRLLSSLEDALIFCIIFASFYTGSHVSNIANRNNGFEMLFLLSSTFSLLESISTRPFNVFGRCCMTKSYAENNSDYRACL